MKNIGWQTWLIATLVLVASDCFAQSQYRFEHYDSRNGLGSDNASSITTDSLGHIWIGSYSSLSRFDGYSFKVFKYDRYDSAQKALDFSSVFGGVFPDAHGNVWLGESKQDRNVPRILVKYDWKNDRFRKYEMDLNGGVVGRFRFEENNSIIWLCVGGRGLSRFNIKTDAIENFPANVEACKNIHDVRDFGSYLLLATYQGLWKFDKSTHEYSRPEVDARDTSVLYQSDFWTIMDNSVVQKYSGLWLKLEEGRGMIKIDSTLSIIKRVDFPKGMKAQFYAWDKDEVIWFTNAGSGAKGIFRYDTKANVLTNVTNDLTDQYSLSTDDVNELTLDQNGNLWVATARGLNRLLPRNLSFQNHAMPNLGGSTLYSAKDSEFLILNQWHGEFNEQVLDILIAPFSRGAKNELQFNRLVTDEVKGTLVQRYWKGKDFFWIAVAGTGGRVVGLPINHQNGIFEASPAVTLQNDPDNPNTISSFMANDVWEDSGENLWVAHLPGGTLPSGLSKVSLNVKYGSKGSVTRFQHNPADPNSLVSNSAYMIYPENEKSFWVITFAGTDLVHVEGESVRFEHVFDKTISPAQLYRTRKGQLLFGGRDGLYEATKSAGQRWSFTMLLRTIGEVVDIKEDNTGRLWLIGDNRMICYDRNENTTTHFNRQDGIEYLWERIHHAKDGRMIVMGEDGFTVFDPLAFQPDRRKVLPLITSLTVNNKPPSLALNGTGIDDFSMPTIITATKELQLDYKHNNFSLEFSAMEMTAPEKNLYRHKLEGYDADWIESDYKNRTATYTNLDAGTYTFRVKASNHHGVWNENERTLKVIILPPPWKTAWAYTGYTIIVLGLLFMARRMIVQRERLKGSLKLAKVEQEKEHFELEKAKEVDRVKTSFFTNISHEFRTPLTLIKGPVDSLLDKFKDDPEAVQRLKLVQRNSDVLLRLINQLLDLAKLESGTMKIEKTNSDINSFIRAIAGSFESLARHKNVTLSVEMPSDRNQVIFDKDKLETILINLINNAIKFTPSGGKVHVQAGCSDNLLTIIVRDTGIGIPVEHQQKVFERFHQVSEAHKEIGTGIGLSLVKELIQLLEGTITVSSEPGKGTAFIVIIPVEAATDTSEVFEELAAPLSIDHGHSNNQFHAQPSHNGAPELPHVLVVEDNDDLRAFIIDSLGQEFYFLEADNGRAGLEKATAHIPDLIISDIMMPEMDGITMAGKIKSDQRSCHIPLILLTAKSTEDSKLQGLTSGADDYLTKPFNKQELLLKIRNATTRQRKLREKVMAELMSEAPRKEVLSADEQFLTKVKEEILNQLSNEQLSVESLAEQIGMSRVHLYRKISGLTGMSVNELIRKLRLHRAAQLLQQQWGPVSQVAYEVGYSNLSYFSKVFKEEFGKLPSEYVLNL